MEEFLKEIVVQSADGLDFINEFHNFNNNKKVITNKTKRHKKYYVYSGEGKPVDLNEKINRFNKEYPTILEIYRVNDESVVFFIDRKMKLSFVVTRHTNRDKIEQLILNLEVKPAIRLVLVHLFSNFIFVGVIRPISSATKARMLSFGYEKSDFTAIHYVFPEKIRTRFGKKGNFIGIVLHLCWSLVPLKKLLVSFYENSSINVPVYIQMDNDIFFPAKSKSRDKYNRHHYIYSTGSTKLDKENWLFARKSITGQYVFVFTERLSIFIVIKERLAFIASRFQNKQKDLVFFEKFSEGASESGFLLFQYTAERVENCKYILSKQNPQYAYLKKKYGKRIVSKNSFSSFRAIFTAKAFISSDLVSHIQRRLYDNDRLMKKKILLCKNKIFLQHGVSLATDLFERGYYNRKVPIAPDYIVVNSQYEKNLFKERASYEDRQLLLTGVPNIDLYVDKKNEEKTAIVFLLTWRPWDLTGSESENSYVGRYTQFLHMITESDFFKNKEIYLVLHPKSKKILQTQFSQIYHRLQNYIYEGDIKEIVLTTKVLITDYSSISYYAFAGGSNVVFYWQDKLFAEKMYGAPNILQHNNVFGDIVEDISYLEDAIIANYNRGQQAKYVDKFKQLCEFTDGKNTERTFNELYRILLGYEVK